MFQAGKSRSNLPIVFANWKMHKTLAETEDYFNRFLTPVKPFAERVEVFVLVPSTVLSLAAALTAGSAIHVGSQNHFWEDHGPYTGEVSAAMIKDCGGEYALIGHGERRSLFGESPAEMHQKARSALQNQLTPILCIGESTRDRRTGGTESVLGHQIGQVFQGFAPAEIARCYLLYEPAWAIGAEEPAAPAAAGEAHGWARHIIGRLWGNRAAKKIRILYGGSVRPENIFAFLLQEGVDGAGVGRSGLEPEAFLEVIEKAASLFP